MKTMIFSPSQQRALILLSSFILIGIGTGYIVRHQASSKQYSWEPFPNQELPLLDINQADSADFLRLTGIGPILAGRIIKFRRLKNGFRSPKELAAVYGLSDSLLSQLASSLCADSLDAHRKKRKLRFRKTKIVELNSATAAQLEALPGIGPVLSKRIVNYRKLIGFYWKVAQIQAVYGLSTDHYKKASSYLRIKLPAKISAKDLNFATRKELARYPSLSHDVAHLIVSRRKDLGGFTDWDHLQQHCRLPAEILTELQVYFFI